MSLTVISKPSGFRPVGGGSLLYVFSESSLTGKTNYRVQITLDGYTTEIPAADYRPNSAGDIVADVASLLRALLVMSTDPLERLISTHVIYQAVWDEGSDSPVPLNTDIIYAYTGVDNFLNHRDKFHIDDDGGLFLIPTDKLYVWAGRTAYIDFLVDDLSTTCVLDYRPDGGSPVNVYAFNGSTPDLHSASYDAWTANGTVNIYEVGDPDVLIASIDVVVLEECNNPVYLLWLNDLGGLSQWLFSYNQLYELVPELMWRENNRLVISDVMTWDQWQMLQELNKNGLEYGDNQKMGAFVQDITDGDNPLNIFTIPVVRQTQTKFINHQFEITLRYPQLPNILI